MENSRICVIGACNIDLISYVKRLPKMGETLHGIRFHMGFGGKGANQAVMAAKLGGNVAMVTKLGKDVFGENTLENFKACSIDTNHVHFTDEAFSGVAPIAVDSDGNNSIIIVTGANDFLTEEEIEAARPVIAESRLVICQLEIPLPITVRALRIARQERVMTIFNPAPAQSDLPDELYQLSDIFCPNESETELLSGLSVTTIQEVEVAAKTFVSKGAGHVILTLGESGSLYVSADETKLFPGDEVEAVDTTGAGDAFVGSLAFFLAEGKSIHQAIKRANQIAAISVTASGTQTSFPLAKDLPRDLLE